MINPETSSVGRTPLVDIAKPKSSASGEHPQGVAILGVTGSIGQQAVRVIQRHTNAFRAVMVAARSNVDGLIRAASLLKPDVVVLTRDDLEPDRCREIESRLRAAGFLGHFRTGEKALLEEIGRPEIDVVINGIVGFSGIRTTLAALQGGKRLALANKESLVAGGPLVEAAIREGGGEIVPVDSEHAALLQCLRGWEFSEVAAVCLTCSGGPFRGRSLAELVAVTPEEALAHPTWKMGPKITIDSATLMNKGLEVIEAHWLFGLDYSSIRVVVHPQSIVHAIAEFTDGSCLAHLAEPDMENPILFALGYPVRYQDKAGAMSWGGALDLHFEPPDTQTFRCLSLAYEAGRLGGGAPCVLNAANEVAVAAFLEKKLSFVEIPAVIEAALERAPLEAPGDLDGLIALDRRARGIAAEVVADRTSVRVE